VSELNALNIKETVMNLMISSPAEELTKQLVEFQRLTIQEGNIKKNTQYSSDNETHKRMLEELWTLSGLTQDGDMKWRKLGFSVNIFFYFYYYNFILFLFLINDDK